MNNKLKGGKLCTLENIDDDIYTKGNLAFPNIWFDENNDDVIIKLIYNIKECENAKIMAEKFDFVPRYYGCYKCDKAYPGVTWGTPIYLVMEKINGVSLNPDQFDFSDEAIAEKIKKLNQYFPEIYKKYLLLCKEGILWNDLYCRNVLIDNNENVIFIDFDDKFMKFFNHEVPPMSYDTLLKKMLDDLQGLDGGKLTNKKNRKTKKRRHKKRNGRKSWRRI